MLERIQDSPHHGIKRHATVAYPYVRFGAACQRVHMAGPTDRHIDKGPRDPPRQAAHSGYYNHCQYMRSLKFQWKKGHSNNKSRAILTNIRYIGL
jgi:hypothetical protein